MEEVGKQDILNTGWKFLGGFFYYYPYNTYLDEFSNRHISWRLNFVDSTRYMKIEAYERNSFDWETVYCGPCRTKEVLDYLMNLFQIKPTDDLQEDIEIFRK